MIFRHSILLRAMARIFGRATAAFVVCATFMAPAASLGFSYQSGQGELNDQRTELESTEHTRATIHQLRRSSRCKFIPAYDARVLLAQKNLLLVQRRTIATTERFESSTDGWTSPLRL